MLFFSANDGATGVELWKSEGTPVGTVRVKDINPAGGSSPTGLTNVNGVLFFATDDGTHGRELWKSDGTGPGTAMVKDINPGLRDSSPDNLTSVNGVLFFAALTPDPVYPAYAGREVWKSDGTDTGTVALTSCGICVSTEGARELANVNGTLYFTWFVMPVGHGTQFLFKSDGTPAGTVIIVGGRTFAGQRLTAVGSVLFFAGTLDRALDGPELMRTADLRLSAIVRGTDNGVYHNHYEAAAWKGWVRLSGVTTLGRPALVVE